MDCNTCKHQDTDICDECSGTWDPLEQGCSCHIDPPCSYCVENLYEEK